MARKKTKWTTDEMEMLKALKQQQIKKNQVNWTKISNILNQKFPNFFKNPKNCREKYVNFIQSGQNTSSYSQWLPHEEQLLYQLYMQYGPSWSSFSKKHLPKPQNCIKNKFNVSLRRLSKELNVIQQKLIRKQSASITQQMLLSILQFANLCQKSIKKFGYTLNQDSLLFKTKQKLLRYSLKTNQRQEQKLLEMIKQIKQLNSKIRCYGIYKTKNKKNYKLTEKAFYSIIKYDKIIIQEIEKFNNLQKTNTTGPQQKIEEKQGENCYLLEINQFDYNYRLHHQNVQMNRFQYHQPYQFERGFYQQDCEHHFRNPHFFDIFF